MTFLEIATLVVDAPGVESAIVQQTVTRDKIRLAREPGSDAWQEDNHFRHEFRVFVRGEKGYNETTSPSLSTAIRSAFEGAKIPLPEELKK